VTGGYELQRTEAKGEGVFATRSFQVGETVMVGVIDCELDHNHAHASQVGEKRFVLHGGLITKVNHSCDPNCGIHLNGAGAHDYVARQLITAGQEITFDYAMRNYSIEHFAAHCQCGSPRCRDRITGWKDLPAERKADYHGLVAPYLTAIDDQSATQQADLGQPPRCHQGIQHHPRQPRTDDLSDAVQRLDHLRARRPRQPDPPLSNGDTRALGGTTSNAAHRPPPAPGC